MYLKIANFAISTFNPQRQPKRYLMDIHIKEDGVYFGDTKLRNDKPIDSLEYFKEQTRYGIRVPSEHDSEFMEWVTGLDVLENGNLWLGSIRLSRGFDITKFIPETIHRNFEPIKHILNNLCIHTKGKDWVIVEDPEPDYNP